MSYPSVLCSTLAIPNFGMRQEGLKDIFSFR
jgi:hypothetical protein